MKRFEKYFPVGIVVAGILMLVPRAIPPSGSATKSDLYAFGSLPVQSGGRIQPLDSLARNSLAVISGKQEVEEKLANKTTIDHPATEWLLDLWSGSEKAEQYRIFRIEHPQLLSLLELPERPGSYRYSAAEVSRRETRLASQSEIASDKDKEKRSLYDEKVIELAHHYDVYRKLKFRVVPGFIPADDPDGKWVSYSEIAQKVIPEVMPAIEADVRAKLMETIKKNPDELVELVRKHVGGREEDLKEAVQQLGGREKLFQYVVDRETDTRMVPLLKAKLAETLPSTYPPAAALEKILAAHRDNKPAEFNTAVAEYADNYTAGVSDSDRRKVRLEAFMNSFDPFLNCEVLYVGVAILAALSWLTWREPLRQASLGLAILTLVIHTSALLARMYIGNRPPVTNLYSSAVFIGWGGLLLCLVLEAIYKLGVGSFAGAALGFVTMYIARFLAESGDTLEMLQAVLDTNFWLATHVTCVTMGYLSTLVAGVIGMVYVIGGMFTNGLRGENGKKVGGMVYGTLCFATLLSFTGTVLGGIWADQSWGRFWGWDPKENGAVLIVIWNALILHARWGGLIKARGAAVLSVFGIMVTFWSWFGTNQLGIGLHAYGFDNRLVMLCLIVWLIASLTAILGMVPLRFWASFGPPPAAKAT